MTSASSDVDFNDYGMTWTRIYGRRTQTNGRDSECPTSGNREQPTQNDTNLISTDIHLDRVRKRSWSWAVYTDEGQSKIKKRLGHTRFEFCAKNVVQSEQVI